MNNSLLRAWWSHRQGLDDSRTGESAATILAATGWARSVAGIGPYLTLFSRGGLSRESVDAAVAATAIHELPTARGCTYILPAADYALGLQLGQPFREPERNIARKLGVTDSEVEKLALAVLVALKNGPLDPSEIRDSVGSAARSLGEEGKKKGMTTTLPLALGLLQAQGQIRRVPVNGRLDQQRYNYTLWSPNPLANCKLTLEECLIELARRYFSWAGPATLAEFQAFSGMSQKACQAALANLTLVPLEPGSPRFLHPADLEKLNAFKVPTDPCYKLVSSLDAISLLRRDVRNLLAPEDLERLVPGENGKLALGGLSELPNHAILDRGRVIGLWEFDPTAAELVWLSFIKPNAALQQAVTETAQYVRDQVGDARSFSLDSPKSREPKLQALRAAR